LFDLITTSSKNPVGASHVMVTVDSFVVNLTFLGEDGPAYYSILLRNLLHHQNEVALLKASMQYCTITLN